jgi:hypothetical protein
MLMLVSTARWRGLGYGARESPNGDMAQGMVPGLRRFLSAAPEVVDEPDGESGQDGGPQGRWAANLFLYTRVLAGLELLKGLFHWSQLLGVGYGAAGFSQESSAWQGATIYFAIVDLVAAVGLWMAPSWGAVMWLFAAASQLGVCIVLPEVFARLWFVLVYELATLGGYAYLAIRAGYEPEE